MELLKNMADFGGVGVVPLMDSIVTAVPMFFPVMLFFIWIFGTGASYFAMLVLTGKKRFWNAITAMSFSTFLISLVVAAMNKTDLIYLPGYWVGFFVLMTLGSWYMLSTYK